MQKKDAERWSSLPRREGGWGILREKKSARMLLSFVFCQNGNVRRIINQPPRSQTQNELRSLSHEPLNQKSAAWYLKTFKKSDTFR